MPTRLTFMIVAFAATVVVAQTAPYREIERWTPRVDVIDVVDVDGDGDDDLLLAGRRTALNDGTGAFASSAAPDCGGTSSAPGLAPQPFDVVGNGVLCVDFNGDGAADLLGTGGAGTLYLRWGTLGGGFGGCAGLGTPVAIGGTAAGANWPVSLAAGDVDGDGDRDVLVGCVGIGPGGPAVPPVLLLNVGGAFVVAPLTWNLPVLAQTVVDWSDLDGDGDLDVVAVGGPAAAPCAVCENVGGAFGPPIVPPTGGLVPLAIGPFARYPKPVSGDLDGDGLKEIVLRASPAGPVVLLTQTAPFAFVVGATATPEPSDVATPVGAATADVDGDGQLELVLATGDGVTFHAWSGGALAQKGPTLPVSAYGAAPSDVDLDGDVDLVLAEAGFLSFALGENAEYPARVAFNDGAGGFVVPEGAVDLVRAPSAFDAADFDGDGDLDLVGYRARTPDGTSGGPTIALNLGDGTFGPWSDPPCAGCPAFGYAMPSALFSGSQPTAPYFTFVEAFDVDLDGDTDLVLTRADGASVVGDHWIRNDGAAGFAAFALPGPPPNLVPYVRTIAVDLDLDGDRDLVTTARPSSAYVRYNLGSGFGPSLVLPVPFVVNDVVAGELDGDGDPDLAFLTVGSLFVVENRLPQGGALTAGPNYPSTSGLRGHATDMNLDGLMDVVSDGGYGWLATGPLTFGVAGYVTGPAPLPVAGMADFDGDGRDDLLGGGGAFYRNSFPLPFQQVGSLSAFGVAGTLLRVADFDRDGDEDLLMPGPRIFSATARQLSTLRPAVLGGWTSFEIAGPALGSWLVAGNFVGVWPTYVPAAAATPFGLLQLDPSSAVVFGLGALDAAGKATLSGVVPASVPGLAGTSFLLQAAVADAQGPRLTGSRLMTMFDY